MLENHDLGKRPQIWAKIHCPPKFFFLVRINCSGGRSNYSHISIKLQTDNNIWASPEAVRGNCLLRRFPASQEDKYRDKIKKVYLFYVNAIRPLFMGLSRSPVVFIEAFF